MAVSITAFKNTIVPFSSSFPTFQQFLMWTHSFHTALLVDHVDSTKATRDKIHVKYTVFHTWQVWYRQRCERWIEENLMCVSFRCQCLVHSCSPFILNYCSQWPDVFFLSLIWHTTFPLLKVRVRLCFCHFLDDTPAYKSWEESTSYQAAKIFPPLKLSIIIVTIIYLAHHII